MKVNRISLIQNHANHQIFGNINNLTTDYYGILTKHQKDDVFIKENKKIKNTPSFGRNIGQKEEKHCKAIINGASFACAGISAAGGKASAFGIDAWTLRGLQTGMFIYLSKYLDVPIVPAFEHAAIEFTSGSYLGCEGSKMATSALGAITDLISGGSAEPISDGTVRCLNAGISAAITKKMGNSFVRQVKHDRMTGKDQTIRLASYFISKLAFSIIDNNIGINTIDNINDKKYITKALESSSAEHRELYEILIDHIIRRDIPRTTTNFITNMATYNISAKMHKEKVNNKQLAKQIALNSFITAAVYEMFNVGTDLIIKQEVADTVIDISEHIQDYPKAFKVFEEFFDEANKNGNLEKICSDSFLSQFKNRTFMSQFSYLTSQKIQEFIIQWSLRKDQDFQKIQDRQKIEIEELEKIEKNQIKKSQQLNRDIEEFSLAVKQQREIIKRNLKNVNMFGYSKIAGYDEQKAFLKGYLNSLSNVDNCDSEDLVNAILFFGPRGNGKTTFASALAEEFGCRYVKMDTKSNKEKAKRNLEKALNKSREYWEQEKRNSILLIDECTAFMNSSDNPKGQQLNKEIIELIKDSAEKYHTMIFMTTNYPEKIDHKYYNDAGIQISIALDPPNQDNAKKVFEHYIEDKSLDYEKIMFEFNKKCTKENSRYSNGQIKDMVEKTRLRVGNRDIDTKDIIQTIKQTKPEITENDLKLFEQNKERYGTL